MREPDQCGPNSCCLGIIGILMIIACLGIYFGIF